MGAKQKPVDTLTCADLDVAPDVRQEIVSVEPVAARAAGDLIEDDGEGHLKIMALLEETKVI